MPSAFLLTREAFLFFGHDHLKLCELPPTNLFLYLILNVDVIERFCLIVDYMIILLNYLILNS